MAEELGLNSDKDQELIMMFFKVCLTYLTNVITPERVMFIAIYSNIFVVVSLNIFLFVFLCRLIKVQFYKTNINSFDWKVIYFDSFKT